MESNCIVVLKHEINQSVFSYMHIICDFYVEVALAQGVRPHGLWKPGRGACWSPTFPHSQQAAAVLSRLSVCQPGDLPRLTALGLPRLDSEKPRAFGLGLCELQAAMCSVWSLGGHSAMRGPQLSK